MPVVRAWEFRDVRFLLSGAFFPFMNSLNPPNRRLLSLDALRGFDMFWIAGADGFAEAFSKLRGGAPARLAAYEFSHSHWAGFRFYDLIFPLFVFMVGVAIPYSLGRIREEAGLRSAVARLLRRATVLYLLGIVYYGGIASGTDGIRYLGVLQRLALCYLGGGLLFMALRPRGLLLVCAGLLIGYWMLLTYVPFPGAGADRYGEGLNLANWFDRMYLPGRLWYGTTDPEGILSTFPAVASCIMGILAGMVLKRPEGSDRQKAATLLLGGAAAAALGYGWGIEFPIIKKIWTSSFALVAGGWSAMLLGTFFLIIDVWKWERWAAPFIWIGSNALTIYLLCNLVSFQKLTLRLAGGPLEAGLNEIWPGLGAMVIAVGSVGLCVLVAWSLFRKKLFLRI